jgi:5-methylcytosine-specific restriction endonuclease McrA
MPYPYDLAIWKELRAATRRRDGYRCTWCGKDVRGFRQSRVDHIHPVRTHPHLALNPDNLRTLCTHCDALRHRDIKGPQPPNVLVPGHNERGLPHDPDHHWYK